MRDIVRFRIPNSSPIIINGIREEDIKKGIDIIHEKPGYFENNCSNFIILSKSGSSTMGRYRDNLRNQVVNFYLDIVLSIKKQKQFARLCELFVLVNEKNKRLDELRRNWSDDIKISFDEFYSNEVRELEEYYLEITELDILKLERLWF